MNFNRKTKLEQVFLILVSMIVLCSMVVCFAGCSGSCMGCRYACESKDDSYRLGGFSYVSEGCCMSSSCKTAAGELLFGEDEEAEEDMIKDAFYSSCTISKDGCCGGDSYYTGCFIGKGKDCGNWSATYGSGDDEVSENTVNCVNGCIGCDETSGSKGFFYDLIYQLLGI